MTRSDEDEGGIAPVNIIQLKWLARNLETAYYLLGADSIDTGNVIAT